MKYLNLDHIRDKFYKFNSYQIFILSFIICLIFYLAEGLLGIERFYHPDSTFYLKPISLYSFKAFLHNPTLWFHKGYLLVSKYLYNNYYLLILLNFILYSVTNVLIYNFVFKKYFKILNNLKLILLFYLLFLDPYRLHLASHILKETILIFILTVIILSNIKIIKIFFVFLLEIFRSNSWIYLFIFITFSKIKKIIKKKVFYISIFLFFLLVIIISIFSQIAQDTIQNILQLIINYIKEYNSKEMPMRSYDQVSQFKNFDFPFNFILKNITWPFMLVSGFFMFFVSSMLFQFLGVIILLNNFLIYIITKKIHISLGLLIILFMISVYTSSYTAMFRYSYIAIYSSIIYFFFLLDMTNINKK
jgi:hypothetical protein